MPETLPSSTPSRSRWRSLTVVFALIGALVATAAPLSAAADPALGTISGTITTVDGQPASNIFVTISISDAQGTSFSASTSTDSQGSYSFADLESATYGFQVYAFGYQPPAWQALTLTAESPSATVNVVLQPFAVGTGTISGTVTADGVPLINQFVSAWQSVTGQSVNTSTDENGFYEFTGLANGSWTISSFAGPQYQYAVLQTVQLSDASPSATVDVALVSWPTGTASIGGLVTDSATGAPVPGMSFTISGVDVPHNSTVTADQSGAYTAASLPAGTFRVSTIGFNHGYLNASSEVTVSEGQAAVVDFALLAANSTIVGHVKDKQGLAVAGIQVFAISVDGTTSSGAITDENGDYVIPEVGALGYTVTLGGVGTPYAQKSKEVTPIANGSATANFTLKPRTTGSFGGFVNGPDSQPYNEPVCVNLHSSKKKKAIDQVTTFGPDFGDGTYSFTDLKPGSYTVSFEDCDSDPAPAFDPVFLGGVTKYADATFVTITAGQDSQYNDFTITPRTATSSISGHVEKSNGTPLAGLVVTAADGTSSTASAVTDASGNYTLTGLFTARHVVSVGGDGTGYKAKQKKVSTVDNGNVVADFTLAKVK